VLFRSQARNMNLCHVFYITEEITPKSLVVGEAVVSKVCMPNGLTSLSKFDGYHSMVSCLAHEFGHNLGCNHDTSQKNLMSSFYDYTPEGLFIAPTCAKKIEETLYSTDRPGKKPIRTLIKDDPDDKYSTPHDIILPGHIYSPMEQCKIVKGPMSSACIFNDEEVCLNFQCILEHSCQQVGLMDGTPCGPNKECSRRKCVDKSKLLGNKAKLTKIYNPDYKKLLLSVCPNGIPTSYTTNKKNMIKEDEAKQAYCNQLEKRMKNYDIPCRDGDNYFLARCCENCIKFNFSKCDKYLRGEEIEKEICGKQHCKLSKESDKCGIPTCKEAKSACFNGGTCVNNLTALRYREASTAFYCICKQGYFGPLCLGFDPCLSNPCRFWEKCRTIGDYGHYLCESIKKRYSTNSCQMLRSIIFFRFLIILFLTINLLPKCLI